MNKLFSSIHSGTKIAVIAHVNPDGDSLGSTMGFSLALKKLGAEVSIFVNDDIPNRYQFLPQISMATLYNPKESYSFDYCFVLDCGDEYRLGNSISILEKSQQVINIDHHISNSAFGDINLVDPEASSTCEIVYNIIVQDLGIEIDEAIATCLYTGIVTDTGNFRYDSTGPDTHRIAATLLEKGVSIREVTYHLHQNNSFSSTKLLGHLLGGMELHFQGKVVIMKVTEKILEEYQVQYDEVEGMINYGRDIEGVEVAVILKELPHNEVKISLRSKTTFDVSKLAQTFGGGGHRKASGAKVSGTIEAVQEEILHKIQGMM